jgi:hypothetical protein
MFISTPTHKNENTVKTALFSTPRANSFHTSLFSRYCNIIPTEYLSLPSNPMNRHNCLICYLISCTVFHATPVIPFTSLFTQHGKCIILKEYQERCQFFVLYYFITTMHYIHIWRLLAQLFAYINLPSK